MEVSYHIKRGDSKLMKSGFYVIYNRQEVPYRTFIHRGLPVTPIHTRNASAEEVHAEYTPYWRIRFIHYSTFENLWNDELKYCCDPEHFEKLKEIRIQYAWCFSDYKFIPDSSPIYFKPRIIKRKPINQTI